MVQGGGSNVIPFCGQDRCLIDANGRVKFSPRFLADLRRTGGELVLHCLPEGALGVYPTATWTQMRQGEPRPAARAAQSREFRRRLRRFGAFTQSERLTNQGRITIPPQFRSLLALEPGTDAMLVGCEVGVEVWNGGRWSEEFERLLSLDEHSNAAD